MQSLFSGYHDMRYLLFHANLEQAHSDAFDPERHSLERGGVNSQHIFSTGSKLSKTITVCFQQSKKKDACRRNGRGFILI